MEIKRTFVEGLYAFKYEGEEHDEFKRLFDSWTDVEYLEDFFAVHDTNDFFKKFKISEIEEAVLRTRQQANYWDNYFRERANQHSFRLENEFEPLRDGSVLVQILNKEKSKKSWLRIYALRAAENIYIVTGGAIKLTQKMEDSPHTDKELQKLDKARRFLQNNGVIDQESFEDFSDFLNND